MLRGPQDYGDTLRQIMLHVFGNGLASPDALERWEQIIFFGKKEILDGIDENNFKQGNYSIWYSQNVTIFFNKDFLTFIYF